MIMDVEAKELQVGDSVIKTVKVTAIKIMDRGDRKVFLEDGTVYTWKPDRTVTVSTLEVGHGG